jgi:membrane protease YdiL (CAAX protease family)
LFLDILFDLKNKKYKQMKKCIHWLSLRPALILVLLALIIKLTIWYLFFLLMPWYENLYGSVGGPEEEFLNSMSLAGQIFMAVFLGPLLETAIFQLLVIFLLQQFTRFPQWIIICISSLLFASTHFYSIYYVLYAMVGGAILAIFFIAFQLKKNYGFAFLMVSSIHALYNSFFLLSKIN